MDSENINRPEKKDRYHLAGKQFGRIPWGNHTPAPGSQSKFSRGISNNRQYQHKGPAGGLSDQSNFQP